MGSVNGKAIPVVDDENDEIRNLKSRLQEASERLAELEDSCQHGGGGIARLQSDASRASSNRLVPFRKEEEVLMERKNMLQRSSRGSFYPRRLRVNSKPDEVSLQQTDVRKASITNAFRDFAYAHKESDVPLSDVVRIFASEGLVVTKEEALEATRKLGVHSNALSIDEFTFVYDHLMNDQLAKQDQAASTSQLCIFLGGACNPTTWRKDIAIPSFEEAGIPENAYYNPQVDVWTPDLVQIEADAKRDAQILLFVIGNETRAIGSMVELAEHATIGHYTGKQIVAVIQDVEIGQDFRDATCGNTEALDLNRGRAYLADVISRHGFVVFQTVEAGVLHCIQLYNEAKSRAIGHTEAST